MHALRTRTATAFALVLVLVLAATLARPQSVQTTTVTGTVYAAGGEPVSGTIQISWPAFTTAAGQAIAAGRVNVNIPANGQISVALTPNIGATPAGLYYTAVYHLADGTTSTEYWVVPNSIQTTVGQVRAKVMPAAQAVQAVSKAYVDQSISQAVSSQITPSGGTLNGPLYLAGDPSQPGQAANKHYVDNAFAGALPIGGGVLSGPVTAKKIGAVFQADQFAGSDFGAQLQACINALDPNYGGTCDARNFGGSLNMASNVTVSTANVTINLPCSTIATSASIVVPAGTRNVTLHGCASRGTSAASGAQGGTVFLYSGSSALLQVGDSSFSADTKGFRLDNAALNTTAAQSAAAQAMAIFRTQEVSLASLYLLGNSTQTALTLDGTGNYTGGTFEDLQFTGYQTAVNAIGHTVSNPATTDWLNASTFVRMHIDCPTSSGGPIAGTVGINLVAGDGNTITGGDVESCSTALHLGPQAQNNTILGLRNENSTTQIQADPGSGYNNWITGGTMFTGKLVDQGTRNSFLDTFHRSFNALNGDWYGSQQDATVTNHFRLGTGTGNERGMLDRYQTDSGYRWTTGLSDAAAGEQYYQVLDELNSVYRLSIGQYNNGQSSTNNQTAINSAGTGAVILNGSNNAGTGGVVFGSGGPASTTVATVDKSGNAHFTGTLLADGTSQSTGTMTVRNNADSEVDYYLWPGSTSSQKGSFTYKDFNGASQWYMLKDQNNNWALNSAVGGIDSFKAYQSSNSGDTYINAANPTGHIRLNYETGAGAETDIYSGTGSSLAAAFLNPTAIKFPGLAASSGKNCLQIDNSGYITNTTLPCGNGSGNIGSGTSGQIAYYTSNGTAISGTSTVPLGAGGTGAATAAAALANLGALPANGATSTGSGSANIVAFPGAVAAGKALTGSGPRIDLEYFGVICDGAYHASNDTILDSTILPLWAQGGYVLTGPTHGQCWFQQAHTASIMSSPMGKMVIDLRGGVWQFGASSGTDLHIVNGASNVFTSSGITLMNGTIQDAGNGASVLVDIDGSALANTGMSKVWLDNMLFKATTQTVTTFQTEATYQSGCINSMASMPYGSMTNGVLGYYGFALLAGTGSGQATGDWTFMRCESFGFDHGLYAAPAVNEVKVFSGTYLLSYEDNIVLNSVASTDSVHVENGWMYNPTGATQRAGINCTGYCTIRNTVAANSLGNMNSVVKVYSNSGVTSSISGGMAFGSWPTVYAYVGGPSDNEISLNSIPLLSGAPSYAVFSSTPNVKIAAGAYYTNQVTPQFIYMVNNPTANSGFAAWGKDPALAGNPELFFFRRYASTSFNMGGIRLLNFQTWAFDNCGDATGSSSFTAIPYANCPASGAGSGGFSVKSSTTYRQTLDFSGMNATAAPVVPDPEGGTLPAMTAGFNVASGDIPRYNGADGHLQGTGYNATNKIAGNFVQQFASANSGVVPQSGGGTANFLRADGTWAAPPTSVLSVSSSDQTGLTAGAVYSNGTLLTLTASPAQTYLEVCVTEVETAAATGGTNTSTLPTPSVRWTDGDTGTVISQSILLAGSSATANTVGTVLGGCTMVHAAASTAIQIANGGYASNPAASMTYALHATAISLR
jgi:hypothetical protein